MINNLSDKEPFFTEFKDLPSGVPPFPGDSAVEQDNLNYYFTLDTEHVITALATYIL